MSGTVQSVRLLSIAQAIEAALLGVANSFRMMRLPDPQPSAALDELGLA